MYRFCLFKICFNVKKVIILKSWQVCDWLVKWLIMLGLINIRRPRGFRGSNVGLVDFYFLYDPENVRRDSLNISWQILSPLPWASILLYWVTSLALLYMVSNSGSSSHLQWCQNARQLQVPVSVWRHSFHVLGFFDRIRRSWASYLYHGDTYTSKTATLYLDTPCSNRWVLLAGDIWILTVDAAHWFNIYACNCIRYHSGLYNRLILCASIFHTRIPTSF